MLRLGFWVGLPVWLLVAVPVLAADDKKPDAPEAKPPATEKEKPPTITAKFLAKVLTVHSDKKTMKVELDEPIVTVNAYHAGRIVAWERSLAAATRDKNPKNRAKRVADAQNHIAYHQARLYERHDRKHQLDVQAADKVTVRTLELPPAYDDKGKPRKYTSEELKQLKGKPNEVGYEADFADVKAGQIVELTVGKGKDVKPPSSKKDDESLDPAKNKPANGKAAEKPAESKPLIVKIVIAKK